ncbi:hypothetical protein Bca52824_016998 [Brassica carinata]|uniref:Uncharacterized protein n=1 Tax=Brassica carinata TaxID=52824 RepID=A0A8X7VM78_BRACI|nr:hypothetical protein Bca52824_016998 [Brassica carinata]
MNSADINPIGCISKQDLRLFLRWAATSLGYQSLADIEAGPPTAELELVLTILRHLGLCKQLDEVDMGMTYEELSVYGRMRKIFQCGPVSMFKNLCYKCGTKLSPAEVAEKMKYFFKYYSINRHKMTSYSPEDNRLDLRQFLYNSKWPYQFKKIDEIVNGLNGDSVAFPGEEGSSTKEVGVVAANSVDPSAADINPIGCISKQDLRLFLRWAATSLGYQSLADIEAGPPTAELELVLTILRHLGLCKQLDEVDMGMTYEELSVYGRMRKIFQCGPVSMFKNLCYKCGTKLSPAEVAEKMNSADINPIGCISKQDLRLFLRWAATSLGYQSLADIEAGPPTAELELVLTILRHLGLCKQLDEVDMGMTYEELSVYGRMRKIFQCGPVSMFKNLCYKCGTKLSPAEVAEKMKYFFKYYSINRHKMTSYSPEDNRLDLRQFLYNSKWPYQFKKIDEIVNGLNGDSVAFPGEEGSSTKEVGVVAANSVDPSAGL